MSKQTVGEELEREANRESMFLKMLTSEKIEISDDELAYFRKYPEEIDEVTASTRVHRFFLWAGMVTGLLAVGLSKVMAALPIERYLAPGVAEFVIDIVFEGGVALVGAALTAYFMGVLLNTQQQRAKAFRKEIRRRLREKDT
ncbi:MAG: hypothetical protein AAFY99_08765 [Pseudomonadota bacterium]